MADNYFGDHKISVETSIIKAPDDAKKMNFTVQEEPNWITKDSDLTEKTRELILGEIFYCLGFCGIIKIRIIEIKENEAIGETTGSFWILEKNDFWFLQSGYNKECVKLAINH